MSRQRTSTMNAGFTLVEVIISVSLGAAIMVGLWTVFDTFSTLQERADTQSARAQLTRGLVHQLQDDLNRVRTPAVRTSDVRSERAMTPVATQGETSNVSLIGVNETDADQAAAFQAAKPITFFGSQSWLIMDLAQLSYDKDLETANSVAHMTGNPESVSPEHRVIYHFVAPELAILNDSIDGGLTRWELSNPPTQIRDLIDELDRGEWGTPNSIVWQTTDDSTSIIDVGEQASDTSSQALVGREQVPEIKRFLFRYYDGVNWRTTWDSRRNGSLPLAVECLLVWRDSSEITADAPNVETLEPADIREELDEISLSSVWENFGQQDYAATSARLPKGFDRYVLCLPAGLPSHRHFADTPSVSLGQR